MIGADAGGGEFQRGALIGGDSGDGVVDLRLGNRQCLFRQIEAVETAGQFDHRLRPPRAHVGDDRRDGIVYIRVRLPLHREEIGEARLEIRLIVDKANGHGRRSPATSERKGV